MCKVLAIPQSRSQSPGVTLVRRNKSKTDPGDEIGHTAELVRVPQCLYWCGMFFFTSYAIVYNNNNNNNNNNINEHELPAENVKEMDPQTVQEAQVQSEGCDEAPRQLSEDQLVIWERLNEIRLSQDQDKVPALKKIAKRRIREKK